MDRKEIQMKNHSLFTLGTISFFIFNTIVFILLVFAIMKNI